MKKRLLSLLFVFVMLLNMISEGIILSTAEEILSDEELTQNVQQIKEKVDADGYTLEYDLFTSLLDNYYTEEEIKALYSLSSEEFSTILVWLRKYLENGRINGYSDTSAAEYFMNYEQYFLLDYFVNGTYASSNNPSGDIFVKDLPDYYWFQSEEDLPDTITFTVQVDRSHSLEDVQWVVVGSSKEYFQNYAESIPYQITASGFSSCLTLSAEDILNLTALVSNYTGTYKPDTITIYAVCDGIVSNICYVTVGADAAIVRGAHYGDVESGEISLDVQTNDVELQYHWNYNCGMGNVDEYALTMRGYWEWMGSSYEETLQEGDIASFEEIGYTRCNVTYTDWEGITHLLSAPLMPVLSSTETNNGYEEHLYRPITCFVGNSQDTYVMPNSDVTYRFFTLGENASYEIALDSLSSDEVFLGDGFTFHVPAVWVNHRTEYDIRAYAIAPSGKKYEGYIERVIVMQEGIPYLYDTMKPLDMATMNKYIAVKSTDTSVIVLSLPETMVLKEGHQYSINAWNSNNRLKVYWYVNDTASYSNATQVSVSNNSFGGATFYYNVNPDTVGDMTQLYYFFKFQNKAGEWVYTSDVFSFSLLSYASFAENDLLYVNEEGALYAVFSNKTSIQVPTTIGGITVSKIASNAFKYCENVETIVLPETVKSVEQYAFETCNNTVKNIQFAEGLLRIEDGAFPNSLETVNLPSTLTYVGDFPYDKIKEVKVSLQNACLFEDGNSYDITIKAEKIIFEEGITTIGKGYVDFALEANEVVLPSTLKTLAPTGTWLVGSMNFPEGLEYIDFGGELISDEYNTFYNCNSELYMTDLVLPNSLKEIKSFCSLPNLESISYPETLVLPIGFFAYSGLTTYTFPEGTTTIPEAFFYGSQVQTIILPEGLLSIGDYAFSATQLETIVLPSTLKTIGNYAFSESLMQSIVIPNSVESIGDGIFQNCTDLSDVTLSKRLTMLPAYTFANCSSLTEVTLPKGISRIGAYAFANTGLNTITLPEGLMVIGTHSFENTQLTQIEFSKNLQRIEAFAFVNVMLETLSIPSSVSYIGNYAFAAYEEWGEPSMKIPYTMVEGMEGVRFLGQYAFAYSELSQFELPQNVKQLHKGIICGTNITELHLASANCTYIGDYAFEGTNLVSLTIPNTVTTIGNGICKDCMFLESVVLPTLSYARIPAEIFSGCENLLSVTIPTGITAIGDYAFNNCRSLDHLEIADTVKTIGVSAFCNCESLSTISVPTGLIAVYDFAFAGTQVKSAHFSQNLRLIGDGAFENCVLLEEVTFEEGVASIGGEAFAGCTSLFSLEIPDTVTNIGDDFIANSAVESVTLSSSLYVMPRFKNNTIIREIICESENISIIAKATFEGCTALQTCVIASGDMIDARAFYGCESLTSFVASSTITSIGSDAFYGCTSLKNFLCGGEDSQLETINSQAFKGCSSMVYCEMGNKVTSIGTSAFEDCTSLENLDLSSALKTIGSCAFRNSGITSLVIGRYVRDINVGYVNSFDSYERKKSCFYDMPKLETVVFLDQIIDVLRLEDAFLYDPMLSTVYLPSSVGSMWAANGIDPTYSLFYQGTDDYGNALYCGINIDKIKANGDKAPIAEDYADALLPGYVGTTYIRYGNYDPSKDYSNIVYYSVYKPNDRYIVLAFGGDYDENVDYYSGFGPALQSLHDNGHPDLYVPTLGEFVIGMNALQEYSVKIMAGDEDISDKVTIHWYLNWLGDNVLQSGSSLSGFAWTNANFMYHFEVSVPTEYAFSYEDYSSGEFVLTSLDEGKTLVVNLKERPTACVNIHLPEEVKDVATLTVMQTVDGKVRSLNVTVENGIATLEISKDSNLLLYCTADGYYRYSGGVDSENLGDTPYEKYFTMTPLPKKSSFRAKFHILDILPDEIAEDGIKEQLTELGSFKNISAKVVNKTSGAETTNLSLEYPYVVIEDYESFYSKGDTLEITLIPKEDAEFYGVTAILLPGDDDYGSTEGTLNGYAIVYFTPTLSEDATTGKVVVQMYDLLGNRVSVDIVSDGEMLVRRYANGAYKLTAFEQNNFIGEMEKLSTFTQIGWTADEYYYMDLYLEAPIGQYVATEVPAAPSASHLLKVKPNVTKTDAEYYQPAQNGTQPRIEEVGGVRVVIPGDPDVVCKEQWYWTSNVRFRAELDDFTVKNAELLLSIPSVYSIEGVYRLTKLGYENVYSSGWKKSSDGELKVYSFEAPFLEDDPTIDLYVALMATDETPIETLQSVGLFSLTLKCDATLEEETKTVYIGLGSVSAVNQYLLESTIGIIHAENISSKTSIPVEVQAPPFSEIALYADGVLVATGKTNYTGSAVLKYDAPFSWLWWQYDVYAEISFASTTFRTVSRSVTCHVDTVQPSEVKAEITITDMENGKVVFPTAGDTKNIVSIQYESGKRENVAIRQSLTEGRKYKVTRSFTASFNTLSDSATKNVAILYDFVNRNNMVEEEILWAEYDDSTHTYYVQNTDTFTYTAAEMLYDLKIPTELGVQWENLGTDEYILLPGQFAAMMQRQTSAKDTISLSELVESSLNDEVSDISLFSYFPAAMQADMLQAQSRIREYCNDASDLFEKIFGLNIDDFTESDVELLQKGMVQDTFTRSQELANQLLADGFYEYPILGEEHGLFVFKEDANYEIYDFSDGLHLKYSSTLLMDMMVEKYEAKEQQKQLLQMVQMVKSTPKMAAKSTRNYKTIYPKINAYDQLVFNKLSVLDDLYEQSILGGEGSNEETLYQTVKKCLDQYENVLKEMDGALQSWLEFEAKYGKEFYDQYLEGTVMMEGFDFVNGVLGEAVGSLLESTGLEVDTSDKLIRQFYDEQTGQVIFDVNEQMLRETDAGQQVGVLVTELKNIGIEQSGNIADYIISKETNALITTQYSISDEATWRIMNAEQKLTQYNGDIIFDVDYGKPNTEVATLLDNSTAMKNGLLTVERDYVHELVLIGGEEGFYRDNGIKLSYTYKTTQKTSGTIADVVIDAENNTISLVQAKVENIKAAKATANKAVKVAGKALETVALVDTVTSMYRDLEGQHNAIDNMIPSYSKVVHSMMEYLEVYEEYYDMWQKVVNGESDRDSYTLLPTIDSNTFLEIYENIHITFPDSFMNAYTFAKLYNGQAYYWAIPDSVIQKQHYIDPETGEKVSFVGYFPCNMGTLLQTPVMKQYYDEHTLLGKRYMELLEKCKDYATDSVIALCDLAEQYQVAALREMGNIAMSWFELVPSIGILGTGAKGVLAGYDAVDGMDYLRCQDTVMSKTAILEDYESSLVIIKKKIQNSMDGFTTYVKLSGKRYPVTYVTYNTAKERWYDLCTNHWTYTYYYTDDDGHVTGDSQEVALPCFPSGHPIGLSYEVGYTGEVQMPNEKWQYYSYTVDNDGILIGWSLEQYGIKESMDYVSRKISSEYTTIKWKTKCKDPQIDPAGYVYEAVLSNRVEGATAKLYYADVNGDEVLWDGTEYGEINPQVTDVAGYYSWMTPTGLWKVRVEKEGYLSASSENNVNAVDGWLPVPPPQLDINIGLVSTVAPSVDAVKGYADGVEILFSQYMDIDSFAGKVTLSVDGKSTDCYLTFTDKEQAGSGEDKYYGKTLVVRRLDGLDLEGEISVIVDGSVMNYAGTSLGENYNSGILTLERKISSISFAQESFNVSNGQSVTIQGKVLDSVNQAVKDAEIQLSIANGNTVSLQNIYVYTDENGFFSFTIKGTSIGSTEVLLSCENYETLVTVQTVENSVKLGKQVDVSTMPYAVVTKPNGEKLTVSQSGTIIVPNGSTLTFISSANGEVGYSISNEEKDPWWCDDYTIAENVIVAAEETYRVSSKEKDKNYSSILCITIELSEEHVHTYGEWITDTDATCTTEGSHHRNCTGCTEVEYETIPVKNHLYGEATYTWDGNQCTAQRICSHDENHKETETVTGIYVKDSDATYTENEKGHYTATFENVAFTTQSTTKDSVEKQNTMLVYTYQTPTYQWDGQNCIATRVCVEDATKNQTETVKGIYYKDSNATCTENEKGHYVATFTNAVFASQSTKKDSVEKAQTALNHNYSVEWTIDKNADCTHKGEKSHHCTRCEAKTDITEIPMLSHDYGDWIVDKVPTTTEYGEKHRSCIHCNNTQTERIEKEIQKQVTDKSVIVESENGFEEGVLLSVCMLNENERNAFVIDNKTIHAVYDIHLEKDNVIMQPNGKVKVKLLLTDELISIGDLDVYYLAEDGNVENMNAIREGNYLIFETTHFSRYAIASTKTEMEPTVKESSSLVWIVAVAIAVVVIASFAIFIVIRKKKTK